jgi:hypothetical protein
MRDFIFIASPMLQERFLLARLFLSEFFEIMATI